MSRAKGDLVVIDPDGVALQSAVIAFKEENGSTALAQALYAADAGGSSTTSHLTTAKGELTRYAPFAQRANYRINGDTVNWPVDFEVAPEDVLALADDGLTMTAGYRAVTRLRVAAIEAKLRDAGGAVFDLDYYANGTAINNSNGSTVKTVTDMAWTAAFAAVTAAGGGTVRLGPGTYLAPSWLVSNWPDDMIIRGAGQDATYILHQGYVQGGSVHSEPIKFFQRTGCGVAFLTVDGNAVDAGIKDVDNGFGSSEISLDGTDCWAYKVTVTDFWKDGITTTGLRPSVIQCRIRGLALGSATVPAYTDYYAGTNNVVHPTAGGSVNGIASSGIGVSGVPVKDVLIEGNRISGMRASAIFAGGNRVMVQGNFVDDCHREFIHKDSVTHLAQGGGQIAPAPGWNGTTQVPSTYCFFVNNVIGETRTPMYASGFEFNDVSHIYGINNTVDTVPGFGISIVNGSTDVHWAHGEFKSVPVGASFGDGISRWSLDDIVFQSCTTAIAVSGASEYWRISHCRFEGNTNNYTPTALTGQNYHMSGNIIVDGTDVPTYTYKGLATAFAQQIVNGATNGIGLYVQAEGPSAASGNGAVLFEQLTGAQQILQFSSAGSVTHGVTTIAPTTVYGQFKKIVSTSGGLNIVGLDDTNIMGIWLRGIATSVDGTYSTSGQAAVVIDGAKVSGTGATTLGGDKSILAVRDSGTARLFVDSDGDVHADSGSATANGTTGYLVFDEYDDVAMARALDVARGRGYGLVETEFDTFLQYGRADLARAGIAQFNDHAGGDGSIFVNYSALTRLHNGALWQLATRLELATRRLDDQESRLLALTSGA